MSMNSSDSRKYLFLVKTKLIAISLIILFIVSLLGIGQPVRADIAPPSQPPGSNIVPGEGTMVQMVYERIVIDLRPPWSDGNVADVTAKFVMRNQGVEPEQMAVGFPLSRIEDLTIDGIAPLLKDLKVSVNGFEITPQYTSENKWLASPNGQIHAIDWAVFDVSFPSRKDVTIELNYKQPPTYDAPTTQYDYTLITGAGWYGPIGRGDIIFRLPYTISYSENYWTYANENIWGSLSTEVLVENEARWHFDDFEPQDFFADNWVAHVIRPKNWELILSARQALINNQYDAKLWMELGEAYSIAAEKLGGKTYDSSNQAITAYQQAAALRPDWSDAHARLALEYYKAYRDSEFQSLDFGSLPDENLRLGALQELSVALALDPKDKLALTLQDWFEDLGTQWKLPPPTPFVTPTFSVAETALPKETSMIVSVIQTKIGNSPVSTQTPELVATLDQTGAQNAASFSAVIFGALMVFAVGVGSGFFLSRNQKK